MENNVDLYRSHLEKKLTEYPVLTLLPSCKRREVMAEFLPWLCLLASYFTSLGKKSDRSLEESHVLIAKDFAHCQAHG